MKVKAILFDLGDTLIRLHPMPEMPLLLAPILAASRGIEAAQALVLSQQLVARLGKRIVADSKAGVTAEPGLEALIAELFAGDPDEFASLGAAFGRADVSRFEMVATGAFRVLNG